MNKPETPTPEPGRLVILSGPSGAGKSTVVKRLLETCSLPLHLVTSATTRPPREGEEDGVSYHFLSDEEFQQQRMAGEFLECKEVFGRGYWYGTPRQDALQSLQEGRWVLLEIDVEGARAVLQQHPQAITLFLHVGSLEELEHRLRSRATDSEEAIQRRLEVARRELEQKHLYRHEIINSQLEQAVEEIRRILAAEA